MTTGKNITFWTLIADAARREPNRRLLADEHGRGLTGLSRYKWPERLMIVDALPRNQFGKVIKKDLREAFG